MAHHAPFKSHGKSAVKAKGTVSRVETHRDGKTATVTFRHEKPAAPKASKGGVFGMEADQNYPEETQMTMKAHLAKRFPLGSAHPIVAGAPPSADVGDTEQEGGENDAGDGEGEVESPAEDEDEAPAPAKKRTGHLIRAAVKGK